MPSASSPALSRVASPNRKHVLLLEVRVGVAEGMGVGGAGCNRLVMSIGELTLGPFPSPGGDVFNV